MDKKTIMALILIGVVFILWPTYMKRIVGVKEPVREVPFENAAGDSVVFKRSEIPAGEGRGDAQGNDG